MTPSKTPWEMFDRLNAFYDRWLKSAPPLLFSPPRGFGNGSLFSKHAVHIRPGSVVSMPDPSGWHIYEIENNTPQPKIGMQTFESGKNATQLGIDKTRQFVIVGDQIGAGSPGDILVIDHDDGTRNPYFKNVTRNNARTCIDWALLAYAPEFRQGVEIVNGGTKRRILANVGDGAICLATEDGQVVGWYTDSQLKRLGWTVKPSAATVKEMTVAEVSALVGQEVKIVEAKKAD